MIGSEDSHARNLGRVVSLAFAAERAERQGLIEASSRLEVGADIPMAPPPRDAEVETTPSGTQRSQTPGRTTPAEPIVARSTPAQAIEAQQSQEMPAEEMSAQSAQTMPAVDEAVAELGGERVRSPLTPRARPRLRPRRPRVATCLRAGLCTDVASGCAGRWWWPG